MILMYALRFYGILDGIDEKFGQDTFAPEIALFGCGGMMWWCSVWLDNSLHSSFNGDALTTPISKQTPRREPFTQLCGCKICQRETSRNRSQIRDAKIGQGAVFHCKTSITSIDDDQCRKRLHKIRTHYRVKTTIVQVAK
nr:hypothetical protein [Tanacetum cinerariifolium]